MKNKIIPIKENEHVGFRYTVTQAQIDAYAKWTIEEKFRWIEQTAKFIAAVQTPEEREMMRRIKGKVYVAKK